MKLLKTKTIKVIDKSVDIPGGIAEVKSHLEPIFICELSWGEYNKLRRENLLKKD